VRVHRVEYDDEGRIGLSASAPPSALADFASDFILIFDGRRIVAEEGDFAHEDLEWAAGIPVRPNVKGPLQVWVDRSSSRARKKRPRIFLKRPAPGWMGYLDARTALADPSTFDLVEGLLGELRKVGIVPSEVIWAVGGNELDHPWPNPVRRLARGLPAPMGIDDASWEEDPSAETLREQFLQFGRLSFVSSGDTLLVFNGDVFHHEQAENGWRGLRPPIVVRGVATGRGDEIDEVNVWFVPHRGSGRAAHSDSHIDPREDRLAEKALKGAARQLISTKVVSRWADLYLEDVYGNIDLLGTLGEWVR
jgi:hypothetical protein